MSRLGHFLAEKLPKKVVCTVWLKHVVNPVWRNIRAKIMDRFIIRARDITRVYLKAYHTKRLITYVTWAEASENKETVWKTVRQFFQQWRSYRIMAQYYVLWIWNNIFDFKASLQDSALMLNLPKMACMKFCTEKVLSIFLESEKKRRLKDCKEIYL